MVGVHEIGVGVEAGQIHITVAGIIHRRVGAVIRGIDPKQIVQAFCLREIIEHLAPEFFERRRVFAVPPEPVAVHFMERAPQDHHAVALEFLQAGSHLVEFEHPAGVRFRVGRQQAVEVNVLVAQPAKRAVGCPGGIVKMRANGHQTALLPILNGRLVRRFRGNAAPTGVVRAHDCRPMPGLIMNFSQQVEIRPGSKIGELAGQQPLVRSCFKTLEILENGPGPVV